MTLLICVVIIAVIALTALKAVANKKTEKGAETRYKAIPLLSENEKKWFGAIREAVPHAHVFAQVAMNQLVTPEGRAKTSAHTSAHNKISRRSIDFVLLNPDMNVLMAIEIDDRSHNEKKRQEADEKKNKALRDAGITLLRFPATPVMNSEAIKLRIVQTIAAKAHAENPPKAT